MTQQPRPTVDDCKRAARSAFVPEDADYDGGPDAGSEELQTAQATLTTLAG